MRDYLGGILVCSMALLIVCYGLGMYLWRLNKIKRRDASGYADPYGPPVLVLVVVVSVIVYITTHVVGSIEASELPTVPLNSNDR